MSFAGQAAYSSQVIDVANRNNKKGHLVRNLAKYFTEEKGVYQLKEEVKSLVEFRYLDLASSRYLGNIDIIFCRNVFIYFTKPLQEFIVDNFHRALKKDGYLIIGAAERLFSEASLIFKDIDPFNRVYQKVT